MTTDARLGLPAKAVDDPDPQISSLLRQTQAKLGFIPNMLLAISVKTISNYTNYLFGTEVDAAFDGRVWS